MMCILKRDTLVRVSGLNAKCIITRVILGVIIKQRKLNLLLYILCTLNSNSD